jgi:DNA-directed RNA polymerase subunit RPC12/RpoP
MQCPKCGSNFLMIKIVAGFERLLILISGLHEYRCQDCDQKFRAPDRRKARRHADKEPAPHSQAA